MKTVLILGTLLTLFYYGSCWQITMERCEVFVPPSASHITSRNCTVSRITRTSYAFTLYTDYYIDFPLDARVEVRLFGMYSNQYKELALNLNRKLCDILNLEFKFVKQEIHGYFFDRCPIKKGLYYIKDCMPNTKRIPRLVWNITNYKLIASIFFSNKLIAADSFYAHVTYDDEYYVE